MYIVRYARRHSCFSLGLGLAVSNFQFWYDIIQLRKKEIVAVVIAVYIVLAWTNPTVRKKALRVSR